MGTALLPRLLSLLLDLIESLHIVSIAAEQNFGTTCMELQIWLAGKESNKADGPAAAAPSAVLTAATRVLHFVMPQLEHSKHTGDVEVLFSTAFAAAMSAFSDSLPDKLLLCACLGALDAEAALQKKGYLRGKQILIMGHRTDMFELIAHTLEQAMQVGLICNCSIYFMGYVH